MKKILVILLLVSTSMFSKEIVPASEPSEQIIYDSGTIVYYCVDGYVEAEFKDMLNSNESRMSVVWFNIYENKETELKCKDFTKWSNR